jgi:hypothetical protein
MSCPDSSLRIATLCNACGRLFVNFWAETVGTSCQRVLPCFAKRRFEECPDSGAGQAHYLVTKVVMQWSEGLLRDGVAATWSSFSHGELACE